MYNILSSHLVRASLLVAMALIGFFRCAAAAEEDPHENNGETTTPHDDRRRILKGLKNPAHDKIGTLLGNLVDDREAKIPGPDSVLSFNSEGSKVLVDLAFKFVEFDTAGIEALGFEPTGPCFQRMCSGYAPVDRLTAIAGLDEVLLIHPAIAKTNVGSSTSEGDAAQRSSDARTAFGIDGTGITVGVMSDSYNCNNLAVTNAADDVASGDLPAGITAIEPDDCATPGLYIDEGRAMMQLVYDVAPGSQMAFATAFGGVPTFSLNIFRLASESIGCDIIVDDVTNVFEPWFQDGLVAQAVNAVSANGVPYFSSIGNGAREAWHRDGEEIPISFIGNALDFSDTGTGDTLQRVTLTADNAGRISFVLQWDEPFASQTTTGIGSAIDLDIALLDTTGNILAQSVDSNIGRDAVEFLVAVGLPAGGTGLFDIQITKFAGPDPRYLKWRMWLGSLVSVEYEVLSSSEFGHPNANGGAGVGAADFRSTPVFGTDPAVQEDFSSAGGTPIFFDTAGNRLPAREVRNQPRFTGPDAGATTFFGDDDGGIFRFFGTSASAPHVAAIAALMLEANSNLTPARVYDALEQTSEDMDDTATPFFDIGFDFGTGHGFVNALEAVRAILPTPVPSAQPSAQPSVTPSVTPSSQPTITRTCSDLFPCNGLIGLSEGASFNADVFGIFCLDVCVRFLPFIWEVFGFTCGKCD